MKKYDSAQSDSEADNRATRISHKYQGDQLFVAARKAGISIGEDDSWYTAKKFLEVRELKREVSENHHSA